MPSPARRDATRAPAPLYSVATSGVKVATRSNKKIKSTRLAAICSTTLAGSGVGGFANSSVPLAENGLKNTKNPASKRNRVGGSIFTSGFESYAQIAVIRPHLLWSFHSGKLG